MNAINIYVLDLTWTEKKNLSPCKIYHFYFYFKKN